MPVAKDGREMFHVVIIKPTHYDDDGYPIQWFLSPIPSNTLACLNALVQDCAEREALGENVDLVVHAFDETKRRVRPDRIMRRIERAGGQGLIMLVGVQSNQFPRAIDIAADFRAKGMPVCVGGFHVTGCLAMLPEPPDDLVAAQRKGISLFAGEAEDGRLDIVLRDAYSSRLAPLYDFRSPMPGLERQPTPFLPRKRIRRTFGSWTTFDLGRGCPFKCSFCTIINVQGRKSRFRTPDDLERIVRRNCAQNIRRFFITDDNFARNRNWEAFLDRLISLRTDEGLDIEISIQVDTLCHRIPRFVEKAVRAGVHEVFIGLENINPDSLLGTKKTQNRIADYRTMLQAWKQRGVITEAGYILGFPNDSKDSILRDIEIIKRELAIDFLDFFFLTPLPGSEDHQRLHAQNVWMDPDMNKYDIHHRVTHHARMKDEEWEEAYMAAWRQFYTPRHMNTVLRRAVACGCKVSYVALLQVWIRAAIFLEGVHPRETGLFRRKYRKDRRACFPQESRLIFYSNFFTSSVWKLAHRLHWFVKLSWMRLCIECDPRKMEYTDLSLEPAAADDSEHLGLYRSTRGKHPRTQRRPNAELHQPDGKTVATG